MGQRSAIIVKQKNWRGEIEFVAYFNQWCYGVKLLRTIKFIKKFMDTTKYYKDTLNDSTRLHALINYVQEPFEDGVFLAGWHQADSKEYAFNWDNDDGFLMFDMTEDIPKVTILNNSSGIVSIDEYMLEYKKETQDNNVVKLLNEIKNIGFSEVNENFKEEYISFLKNKEVRG